MASRYQQQALVRKLVYIAIILALAFFTYLIREAPGAIRTQAEKLGVQEESLGDVELTDSMVRLSLTGSRGFAVCCLWLAAHDKQKKHEWNELDVLVKSLIKLQPHFVTPWLFQSWNLAYNVSVESDRVKDKYFYITEGIKLISQGCRINRLNPDMRYTVGFYTQHKIGLADEMNVLRSLFQMSAIDPKDRDPGKLRTLDEKNQEVIDMAKFEQFCIQHPMLVRRLRETLNRSTPGDIVDFLAENQKIPSMYDDSDTTLKNNDQTSPLLAAESRFPPLPPLTEGERANPSSSDFDNYQVSRDWYTYSVQLMPPPDPKLSQNDPNFDRTKYRMPRYMMPIIFRQYPARAQTYVAETLEKEGWFDKDGWKITGEWFKDDKFSNGKEAIVGDGANWAARTWGAAFQMWRVHGERTGLYLPPERLKSLEEKANKFRMAVKASQFDKDAALPADIRSPELDEGQLAHQDLYWLTHYQRTTNFLHFYYSTQVEQETNCIELRKAFFQANQFNKVGEREAALEIYQTTLPKWRELLLAHKEFREDEENQENTYETVYRYLDLVQTLYGNRNKQVALVAGILGNAAMRAPMATIPMPPVFVARDLVVWVNDPIGKDSEGVDMIPNEIIDRVLNRRQLPLSSRPSRTEPVLVPPAEPGKPQQ